jgi:hypothetical protein
VGKGKASQVCILLAKFVLTRTWYNLSAFGWNLSKDNSSETQRRISILQAIPMDRPEMLMKVKNLFLVKFLIEVIM